jgi:hypothetical protein
VLSILQSFNNKAELRESKDEILVGEIVRAMARQGWPAVRFLAGDDRQVVRFRTPRDPVLYQVYVTLDRKTGGSALAEMVVGSKATLSVSAEVKNRLSDPDDLIKMYRTDFANLLKIPVAGGIKLNHQLNSVFATTTLLIEINDYVLKGDPGVERLAKHLGQTVDRLREKLASYKK